MWDFRNMLLAAVEVETVVTPDLLVTTDIGVDITVLFVNKVCGEL